MLLATLGVEPIANAFVEGVYHLPLNLNAQGDVTLPLNVDQSVEDKYPSVDVVACVIASVLFALKSPPPVNGAVVAIVLVGMTAFVANSFVT
jgi:hypothetical protein